MNGYTNEPASPLVPIVHLGGTGLGMLMTGWSEVDAAIEKLSAALRNLELNARGYAPAGQGAIDAAFARMGEHAAALDRLNGDVQEVMSRLHEVRADRESRGTSR
mgnify:CR=1 FL=1